MIQCPEGNVFRAQLLILQTPLLHPLSMIDSYIKVISAEIMQIHHSKHHQTYVNNLNVVEEKLADAVAKNDVSSVIG